MPSYNLTQNEEEIIVTWLGEPEGYLDFAINSLGVSAREALIADPGLDVTEWIRSVAKRSDVEQSDWDGCSRWWWIWKNDQVNITPPTRPPEAVVWVVALQEEADSVVRAFDRADMIKRNQGNKIQLHDLNGVPVGEMPSGSHLQHQSNIFGKVVTVLGG